ncbi:ABC transporter permease [Kribbella shirazensis]|uniref:Putative ABC transport system permease protein n=1 Tax=Kribbella shirazensis TaxID=1105143 RepID=A0A7X6A126_9ACTN|nr:ABC transporter permease [Kribbella shirazensis]NIK57410.1 putative ABC transport system permease protein [Kribbella shirazensis]
MMRLAVRTLRHRKSGFIATFVAVVFGTAIVMACGGLMETGIRSNVEPQRLAATSLVVTGKQSHHRPGVEDPTPLTERVGVPVDALPKIRSVEGVSSAVGDYTFPAIIPPGATTPTGSSNQPGDTDGRPAEAPVVTEGHNWSSASLAPYRLSTGSAPRSGEVVVSSGKVGEQLTLIINGEPKTFTISGVAAGPPGHAFFSDQDAAQLVRNPERFADIGVQVAPGTDISAVKDRLEEIDGNLTVRAGVDRGLAEHPEAESRRTALIAIAGSFGGIAAMTMMFVVASTLALAAQHREREFALLRGIGTTPGQVRRMILGEAMMVSLPAVLLGILPGTLLGRFLFDQLGSHGVASPVVEFSQGWIPFAAGAGAAVLAAVGAALIAARRSAKIRPVEALMEASLQRKWFSWIRLLFGLLFLGGGMALLIVTATVMSGPLAASTAGPSILCWAIGVALLGPFWTKLVLAFWRWPVQALTRVNGRLAIRNLSARSVALSSAVMPVMLAVGISTANLYMQTTQVHASSEAFTRDLRANAVLVSNAGVSETLLSQVRSAPGVASASAFVRSMAAVDDPRNAPFDEEGAPVIGVDAQGADGTAPVRLTGGSLAGLTGSTAAVPEYMAQKTGRGVGSEIAMTLGDGTPVKLRVIATFAAERGYESIILPASLVAAHTTDGLTKQVLVRAAPGADVRPALTELAAAHPGVQVADRSTLVASNVEDLQTQAWINYMLVGMLIAYTAVSVVNTLVSTTLRRRREFALQRLTGSTRFQVLRMLTTESTLVTLTGITLGTAVAMACLLPFAAKVSDNALPTGPIWIYLVVIGAATLLTFASTLIPATTTLRHSPTQPTHTD